MREQRTAGSRNGQIDGILKPAPCSARRAVTATTSTSRAIVISSNLSEWTESQHIPRIAIHHSGAGCFAKQTKEPFTIAVAPSAGSIGQIDVQISYPSVSVRETEYKAFLRLAQQTVSLLLQSPPLLDIPPPVPHPPYCFRQTADYKAHHAFLHLHNPEHLARHHRHCKSFTKASTLLPVAGMKTLTHDQYVAKCTGICRGGDICSCAALTPIQVTCPMDSCRSDGTLCQCQY